MDPRSKYPQPPFRSHKQKFPGLESQLNPLPDFGHGSYTGHERLKGKTALITGGDSGIGRATAYAYACEGANVAISYLPSEETDAETLKKSLHEKGLDILLLPGDIQSESQCQHIVAQTRKVYGAIDILVNNAAYQKTVRKVSEITEVILEQTYRTNVYAPFFLTKAVWEHMKPGSSILNIASIQAYNPSPHILVYATTKAALVSMTKLFAEKGAKKGIRVNAVAPGPIWTPLNTIDPSPGQVEHFGEQSWLGRPGQPIEVAHVCVFLASEESSYVTGHVYGVTGGMEMGV